MALACSECGHKLELSDADRRRLAGKFFACPECGTSKRLPLISTKPETAAPSVERPEEIFAKFAIEDVPSRPLSKTQMRKPFPSSDVATPILSDEEEPRPSRRSAAAKSSIRWIWPVAAIALLAISAAWYLRTAHLRIDISSLSPTDKQALTLVRKYIQDDNPKTKWDEVRWWGCEDFNTCRYCRLKYRKIQRGPLGEFEVTHDDVFRVMEKEVYRVEPGRRTFDGSTSSMIQWAD